MAPLSYFAERVVEAVSRHPAVRSVRLVGSRSRGEETAMSDWDFVVDTGDVDTVAGALPELVAPLDPLSHLWDPLGDLDSSCFMFFVPGPAKVDLLVDRPHDPQPPWEPRADTLSEMDAHFWDWIWWIASKRVAGRDELVAAELEKLHDHLLRPMGAGAADSVEDAVREYLRARADQERRHGAAVDPALGEEIVGGLRRAGYAV